MQQETMERVSQELFDLFDLPPDAPPADLYDERYIDDEKGGDSFTDTGFWESVIPYCQLTEDGVMRTELYPIELGMTDRRPSRGTPRAATPEAATRILDHIAELSSPYGTSINQDDGIGVIDLE